MEYLYAALLLHKAGKKVDEKGVTKVVKASGLEVNESKVKALVAALSEIDIDEALKAATVAPTAAAPVQQEAQSEPQKKAKKEEEKEEKEEEALAGLSALFG